MAEVVKKRINAVLVVGGKFHDMDFARLELLKLLAEDERVRVRVFEDYTNIAAIEASQKPFKNPHPCPLAASQLSL